MEKNNFRIIITPVPDSELDVRYGERKIPVGKCFSTNNNRYYKQLPDGVLHLNLENDNFLVNILHVGFLNDTEVRNFIEVSPDEFNNKLSDIILKLSALI